MSIRTKAKSAAEKKEILLKIIRSSADEHGVVFNLKELEKLAGKKGVVEKTVKDILAELVEDGLVEQDKIGASQYFYSFPSANLQKMQIKLQGLEDQVRELQTLASDIQLSLDKARQERDPSPLETDTDILKNDPQVLQSLNQLLHQSPDVSASCPSLQSQPNVSSSLKEDCTTSLSLSLSRKDWLKLLDALQKKKETVAARMQGIGHCNPQALEEKKEQLVTAKQASIRWTDNIFQLQKHLKDTIGMSAKDFGENFEVDMESFDYEY